MGKPEKRIVIRLNTKDEKLLRLIQDVTGETISNISRIGWAMYGESLGIKYKSFSPAEEKY